MGDVQSGNLLLHQKESVDLELFDGLYRRYHQAVYANICKMVHQPQAAEDILQEVFLALWENRHKLEPVQVSGWLFVVSYNKAATYLKKKLKAPDVVVQSGVLPEAIATVNQGEEELHHIRLSIVEEAISHLPARKKEVFRLCRFEGKSYDEVASLLGISVISVRDYLKQSTQFIKKYVSIHYPHFEATAMSLWIVYLGSR